MPDAFSFDGTADVVVLVKLYNVEFATDYEYASDNPSGLSRDVENEIANYLRDDPGSIPRLSYHHADVQINSLEIKSKAAHKAEV